MGLSEPVHVSLAAADEPSRAPRWPIWVVVALVIAGLVMGRFTAQKSVGGLLIASASGLILFTLVRELRLGLWSSRALAGILLGYFFFSSSFAFSFYDLSADISTGFLKHSSHTWATWTVFSCLMAAVALSLLMIYLKREEEKKAVLESSGWLVAAIVLLFVARWVFST